MITKRQEEENIYNIKMKKIRPLPILKRKITCRTYIR
jgi:hypothetical protein